jgi:hypothetical protein
MASKTHPDDDAHNKGSKHNGAVAQLAPGTHGYLEKAVAEVMEPMQRGCGVVMKQAAYASAAQGVDHRKRRAHSQLSISVVVSRDQCQP